MQLGSERLSLLMRLVFANLAVLAYFIYCVACRFVRAYVFAFLLVCVREFDRILSAV